MTHRLIFNKQHDAPTAFDDGRNSATPTLCSMHVDLENVPDEYFEKRMNSKGKKFERLHYSLAMKVLSGNITFDLRVDGIVHGQVTAKFE